MKVAAGVLIRENSSPARRFRPFVRLSPFAGAPDQKKLDPRGVSLVAVA
jgi:hypothetical protein